MQIPMLMLVILWFGGALFLRRIRVQALTDPSWGQWVLLPLYVFCTAARVCGLALIIVGSCFMVTQN